MTLTTSWTGTTADLVFTDLDDVRANCSELACVTGIAEKPVTAPALIPMQFTDQTGRRIAARVRVEHTAVMATT